MTRRIVALLTVAAVGVLGLSAPAQATPPKVKKYSNCAALNKVFKHGVGRNGAKDKVSGKTKPVTNFSVYTKMYDANKAKLDRDKDGIACEKR
ncbi:MAG TPA: excalibur calcium-binding domain-containing protein [Actinoplanes sp.]|nr:excalibur calcium-binding domain-containing protein [Actinoplanes sp.]